MLLKIADAVSIQKGALLGFAANAKNPLEACSELQKLPRSSWESSKKQQQTI